jgi:hypothetical protein
MKLFLVRMLSWSAPVGLFAVKPIFGVVGLLAVAAALAAWRSRAVTA